MTGFLSLENGDMKMNYKNIQFIDKNFKEITEGAYCFYSERPYSNYADGLYKIINVNNRLKAECLCVNVFNKYQIHHDSVPIDLVFAGKIRPESPNIYDTDFLIIRYEPIINVIQFMEKEFPLESINIKHYEIK
jgi:hypothetical protein